MNVFGQVETKIKSVAPPGQVTGHANARCYLRSLNDCCATISREHILSASVIEQIAEQGLVSTDGLPWFAPDEAVKIKALAANVLCRRHNSALEPLDAAAARAFRQIRAAYDYATKRSLARRPRYFLVSGEGLERWALKVMLGFVFAKYARSDGDVLLGKFSLDMKPVLDGLYGHGLATPLGLYVDTATRARFGEYVSVTPLTHHGAKMIGGLRLNLGGLGFHVISDSREGNPEFFKQPRFHKPRAIDLNGPDRTSRIVLTWPQSPAPREIVVGVKIGRESLQR